MKAAVLEEINADLRFCDLDRPRFVEDLGEGLVEVKMLCAGICGAQLQEIRGEKGNPSHLPHLLGHEGCGIVTDIGAGVNSVTIGDKVVVHWRKGTGCNQVSGWTYYEKNAHRYIRSGPCTCFGEYTCVSENRCTKIPDDVPNDLAALFGCALSTALATIENETRWGQSILIIGCGGVGLSFILAAKLNHLWPIMASDKNDSARQAAIDLGAMEFSDTTHEMFDVVIDTTGVHSAIMRGIDSVAPSGKFIMIGQPRPFDHVTIDRGRSMFDGEGKTIKASQAGGFNPATDIQRYVSMWRTGALDDYHKIIGHRIALEQINDGIAMMQNGTARGRVMIDFATTGGN